MLSGGLQTANTCIRQRGRLSVGAGLAFGVQPLYPLMRLLLTIALIGCSAAVCADRHADFSGTWRMDPARSESAHQDIPGGTGTIKLQLTGDALSMETTRFDGDKSVFHETLNFKLDGSETTSPGDGNVPVAGKARWDGEKLVVETVRSINDSDRHHALHHTLNAAGTEMTIDKTLTAQHGYMGRNAPTTGRGKDVFTRVAPK